MCCSSKSKLSRREVFVCAKLYEFGRRCGHGSIHTITSVFKTDLLILNKELNSGKKL